MSQSRPSCGRTPPGYRQVFTGSHGPKCDVRTTRTHIDRPLIFQRTGVHARVDVYARIYRCTFPEERRRSHRSNAASSGLKAAPSLVRLTQPLAGSCSVELAAVTCVHWASRRPGASQIKLAIVRLVHNRASNTLPGWKPRWGRAIEATIAMKWYPIARVRTPLAECNLRDFAGMREPKETIRQEPPRPRCRGGRGIKNSSQLLLRTRRVRR